MRELAVQVDGGTVACWVSDRWENDRDTLFFLHGLTGDHTMFESQYRYFEGNYNMILWDAPAHGKSRPFEQFTYEKAAQAAKKILDTLEVSSAIFIGQSMGGFITQSVIKRYPDAVKAFISIDSTPFGEAYYSRSDRWWLRQIEWMSALYPLNAMKKAMARQVSVTGPGRQNMLEMLSRYGKKELCHLMGIGFAGFLEDNCDLEIKCPVLLILGEKDKTGKVQAYNRAWAKRTGFPLTVIPGAAHNANVDQPDAVNKAISEFIVSQVNGAYAPMG